MLWSRASKLRHMSRAFVYSEEVYEIRNNTVRFEKTVMPLVYLVGFRRGGILINSQEFMKTSNVRGIRNNVNTTDTNRIALFFEE